MRVIRNPYIDYDKSGYCVLCHDELIVKEVIDGILSERVKPQFDEAQLLMNDNSKMRVCICRSCKSSLNENDFEDIMISVYKGWEREVKELSWSEDKKKNYLDTCANKSIVRVI